MKFLLDFRITREDATEEEWAEAKEKIEKIEGTLVSHPLKFLKAESKIENFADLLKNASVGLSKEGLAQLLAGDVFE